MALKSILDNLDDVPEALKPFYKQVDDKFILQVDGADNLPEVANLRNAYAQVKEDRNTIRDDRDALKTKVDGLPEDFDPEKWAKIKDGKPDDAALINLRASLEKERDTEKTRANNAENKLGRFAVERDLDEALRSVGITDSGLVKGARAVLAGQVKTDSNGKGFVETDMGPSPLSDFVSRWAAGEGKSYVTPPKGGGNKGNEDSGKGDSNPWDSKTVNLSRQGEILKDNPSLAKQLMTQAK